MVELAEAGKGTYRLERYAIEPLPKDVIQDGNIANLDQVGDALRRGFKRLGSRNRNIALALPAAMVITKKIIVPSGQKEEELELTVEAEANQYIPFALDEVNLDFQILGPAPNNPDEVEVLNRRLAQGEGRGSRRDCRVRRSEAAGDGRGVLCHPGGVPHDRTVAAGERPRPEHRARRHRCARHAFLRAPQQPILFSRDQAFGGNQLTMDISGRSTCRPRRPSPASATRAAGELRQRTCCSRSWRRSPSRSPGRCSSSSPPPRTTRSIRSSFRRRRAAAGLDELVAKRAGVATVIANPFASMQTSDRIRARQLAQDAPMLLIACGLALRSFE